MRKRGAVRVTWVLVTGILAAACSGGGRRGDDADTVVPEASEVAGEVPGDEVPGEGGAVDQAGEDLRGDAVTPVACRTPALANASLPVGYCAWAFAEGLDRPRGLFVASNGDVLVAGAGKVMVLWDADGDGRSGLTERAVLATAPGLNHGVAAKGGHLYASSSTTVFRWQYAPGRRDDLGSPDVAVRDIPAGGHATRTLVFDGLGRLYVAIGSGSNLDADASRAGIRRFPAELPAGGVAWSDGEWFAIGLRNEVGLAFDGVGRLWGVENGSDNLHRADLGGDIHFDNPAEEINRFDEPGRFYGYPYCWTELSLPGGVGLGPGTQWAYEHVMGDGTHTDAWCRDPANVVPPRFWMDAHTAPLGITFYDGDLFPADAVGDAFIAQHGSWNDDPATGYKVVRVRMQGGEPVAVEPLLESAGPGDFGAGWTHRPVDVKVGPGGLLLVTSDASGAVIAVGHAGG